MMKGLFPLLLGLLFTCLAARANEEYNVVLENGDPNGQKIELPYGNISLRYLEYGPYRKVLINIENTTFSQAILLFRDNVGDDRLRKATPKIEFEKTYPGSKGNRSVQGFSALNKPFVSIIPEEKTEIAAYDLGSKTTVKLEIPVYLAKYNPKQLGKKGAYKVNYKILNADLLSVDINIKGWTENDPEYVSVKEAVENFMRSLKTVSFCRNKRHSPSLAPQQKPYKDKKDSLVKVIQNIVSSNGWMSDTEPYIAFNTLRAQLEKVNLNGLVSDCGGHKGKGGQKLHSCGYCSLSAQQIYHQLDDLYQQLRNGRISKETAVNRAQGMYSCFQANSGRKKEAPYSEKISKFHNRIINY